MDGIAVHHRVEASMEDPGEGGGRLLLLLRAESQEEILYRQKVKVEGDIK